MGKSKNKTFHVNGRLALEVCIPIIAESLENAIEKSKSLKETDFVDILGDFNDGEMRVTGIFEEYKKIEL